MSKFSYKTPVLRCHANTCVEDMSSISACLLVPFKVPCKVCMHPMSMVAFSTYLSLHLFMVDHHEVPVISSHAHGDARVKAHG